MAEALLIIDFQNDFTPPDGALAVPEGDEIADRLNELAASPRYDLVIATRDWHPPNHSSFDRHGGPWPEHCVQGSPGAELHPELERQHVDHVVDKGQDPDTEGYSAFERPELDRLLKEHDIDKLTIAGLATDVCVRATALDAIERGYQVEVDAAGSRGVDPENTRRALDEIRERGGTVVTGAPEPVQLGARPHHGSVSRRPRHPTRDRARRRRGSEDHSNPVPSGSIPARRNAASITQG